MKQIIQLRLFKKYTSAHVRHKKRMASSRIVCSVSILLLSQLALANTIKSDLRVEDNDGLDWSPDYIKDPRMFSKIIPNGELVEPKLLTSNGFEWVGGYSDRWMDAANWSTNHLPDITDQIHINIGSNGKVPLIDQPLASYSVDRLSLGNAKKYGELIIKNGASLSVNALTLGVDADSMGKITVSGPDSTLNINSWYFTVGDAGNAHVIVENGGQLNMHQPMNMLMGNGSATTDTLTITGKDSNVDLQSWLLTAYAYNDAVNNTNTSVVNITDRGSLTAAGVDFGYSGHGIVNIDQGKITVGDFLSAFNKGSKADVDVHGKNSVVDVGIKTYIGTYGQATFNLYDYATLKTVDLVVGSAGSSTFNVTDGGQVLSQVVYLDSHVDGTGRATANLSGAKSKWLNNGYLFSVATYGDSALNVFNEGALENKGILAIGTFSGAKGVLNVSDEGSLVHNEGGTYIGSEGHGVVNVVNNGKLVEDAFIALAVAPGSTGVLNIGLGDAAGKVQTPTIMGGEGQGVLNFNHRENIVFEPKLEGDLTVNHYNKGTTTVSGVGDYVGETRIASGVLKAGAQAVFSGQSSYHVAAQGTMHLNDYQQLVGHLENKGVITFGRKVGNTLSVQNYHSENGVLALNSTLNDDASPTDRLYVKGNTSGSGLIKVTNQNGVGEETKEGIKIIDVSGDSNASFRLLSEYSKGGNPAVMSGVYAYTLQQGSASDPNDGHWYMKNSGYIDPVTPYALYPLTLLELYTLPTLRQRVGNRYWLFDERLLADQPDQGSTSENGLWVRLEQNYNHVEPRRSTVDNRYNQNIFKWQMGIEDTLFENDSGLMVGGATLQYTVGSSKIKSKEFAAGKVETDVVSGSLTATWYGQNGFYMDNQALIGSHSSDISSDASKVKLVHNNKGTGYAFSTEIGRKYDFDEERSMTPQAQLIYGKVNYDDFTDAHGTKVKLDKGRSLVARLGVTYDKSWSSGRPEKRNVYGIANINYEFFDGTRVDIGGVKFENKKDNVWVDVGVGGVYGWDKNQYGFYGELLGSTGVHAPSKLYSVKGTIGFRASF